MPLHEEPLHRPDGQRAVDVAAAAGTLAGGGADVGAHRRDRVRLAGEDVPLLEPPLGGEVEVAPAVGADGTGLLALDVALEPGRVHGLDEELLGLIEGHEGDGPLILALGAGRREPRRCGPPTRGRLPSREPPCTAKGATWPAPGRLIGRIATARTAGLQGTRACAARRREPCDTRRRAHRRGGGEVDATHGRSYADPDPECSRAGWHRRAVSPSEIAFLAFGLVLGAAIGAALVQASGSRLAPRREVRLTITPNAIPARRSHTLAVPYDTAAPGGHPRLAGRGCLRPGLGNRAGRGLRPGPARAGHGHRHQNARSIASGHGARDGRGRARRDGGCRLRPGRVARDG